MTETRRSTTNPPRRQTQVYRVRNQDVVVPHGYFAVGHIAGVHALRGEVKVELFTDFPERFAPGAHFRLGSDLTDVRIATVRPHKQQLLVQFEGVTDRTAAEQLRGLWLFMPERDAADLEEGAYWIHDIIGLQVWEAGGGVLGAIVDVLVTGANDVYVVRPAPGANQGQEILLPAVEDVVLEVDLEQHRMTVRLPEGLLDAERVD